ncbi:nucleotide sugar dehydrogenase [Rhizobiaceae bacterium]|nr:nucleotide sugar dehydrogenase [Rhizobiaceae bacterium]
MTPDSEEPLAGHAATFIQRVKNRKAIVGIVGLGYVGLPLVLAFQDAGFSSIGFDVDRSKIDSLAAGRTYIKHISDERCAALAASGQFEATTDFERIGEVDAIIICVPTPLSPHRDPDMTYVEATAAAIALYLKPGQLVTLESTTYPMTSEGLLRTILEAKGDIKVDRDIALAYSPEREDPGNPNFKTSTIPKVVGADIVAAGDMAEALYNGIVENVVRVGSMRTAEAVKLTENIFRSVNIALVNELKVIFDRMNIDVFEVIDAAKTKPFGFMPFYPGPGIGGHCIPIDPFYLTWKAREFGLHTRFIELAGEINNAMPDYVINRLSEGLSDHLGMPIRNARVLIVGLAYKKNVDDMRESPSVILLEKLEERGAKVAFYDPHIPVVPKTREHMQLMGRCSIDWTREALGEFEAALIATDHDNMDLDILLDTVPLVVDTRNATKGMTVAAGGRIVRA